MSRHTIIRHGRQRSHVHSLLSCIGHDYVLSATAARQRLIKSICYKSPCRPHRVVSADSKCVCRSRCHTLSCGHAQALLSSLSPHQGVCHIAGSWRAVITLPKLPCRSILHADGNQCIWKLAWQTIYSPDIASTRRSVRQAFGQLHSRFAAHWSAAVQAVKRARTCHITAQPARGVSRRNTPSFCSSVCAETQEYMSSCGVVYDMLSCTRRLKRATTMATAILISSCTHRCSSGTPQKRVHRSCHKPFSTKRTARLRPPNAIASAASARRLKTCQCMHTTRLQQ